MNAHPEYNRLKSGVKLLFLTPRKASEPPEAFFDWLASLAKNRKMSLTIDVEESFISEEKLQGLMKSFERRHHSSFSFSL